MKKHWRRFIISTLAVFFLIITNPLTYSQPANSSTTNNTSTNSCDSNKAAVCLGDRWLFTINNTKKVGGLTPEERAKQISERIKAIADSPSIELKDLEIDKGWSGGIISIKSPETVIITLTDDDIKAEKINIKDKEKKAAEYLAKIQNTVESYRQSKSILKYFGWFNELKILSLILILKMMKIYNGI
jgi:hypothetical protein